MTHLSAFTLDALALGTETAGAREHLAACARCRGDLEAAQALREHFTAHVLSRTLPVRRRRPVWPWFALPALAAAIALVAIIVRPSHRAAEPELAIKGDAAWQVFANRDGQTFAVHDGTELAPGDRIRFAVIPDGARYLLVASIDGAGVASIYYPYDGAESAAIPAGDRVELPGSIVLDAAPGPERVFAVFSDEPIGATAVADRLRAVGADGPDAIRRIHALVLPGVRGQTSVVFEKSVPQ
ncbi:MAG TPA: DUF4384 domain-containing protein [Kofleriaceae bacterium]